MTRLIAIIAVALPLFACTSNAGSTVFPIEGVTPAKNQNAAPDFTWKQNGALKTFSQVAKGKVVVLNLWATWCGPCRKEIPDLIQLSNDQSDVMVIGVSVDEAAKFSNVSSFVEKNNITYLSLMDSSKKLSEAFGGITAIPTTFIIKDGVIIQKIVGARSKLQFEAAINQAK